MSDNDTFTTVQSPAQFKIGRTALTQPGKTLLIVPVTKALQLQARLETLDFDKLDHIAFEALSQFQVELDTFIRTFELDQDFNQCAIMQGYLELLNHALEKQQNEDAS